MRQPTRTRGSTVVEFTLVGIPLVFTLVSVFEMGRGMWLYHTIAYAAKEGTRYAIVRGAGCCGLPDAVGACPLPPPAVCTARPGTCCAITVAQLARHVAEAGIGLDPGLLRLELTSRQGSVTCAKLSDCFSNGSMWPPEGSNAAGMDITIRASYPFQSAIAMFWPGAGPGLVFPTVTFPAASTETIQF